MKIIKLEEGEVVDLLRKTNENDPGVLYYSIGVDLVGMDVIYKLKASVTTSNQEYNVNIVRGAKLSWERNETGQPFEYGALYNDWTGEYDEDY